MLLNIYICTFNFHTNRLVVRQGLMRKQKQTLATKGFSIEDGMSLQYPYHSIESGKFT